MDFVTVYGEVDDLTTREPCLALNVKGMTTVEVIAYMATKGISVHNRISDAYSKHTLKGLGIEECVRVSMGHYNSPEEVEAFLHTLEQPKI
jgi:selenocysteine lyase/cysteine desulfurase